MNGSYEFYEWFQMTAKGDNSVKIHFRVIARSQSVSLITDVKFDIKKRF